MKKLKNIIIALCMCVCIGFSCLGLSGCADTRTKEELASLKTQVEQLQTESATLERDKALTKIYEAFAYTADDSNTNETSEWPNKFSFRDITATFYSIVDLYRVEKLELNKVYSYEYNLKDKTLLSIIVNENELIYQALYSNSEYHENYQLRLTLDELDNITHMNFILEGYYSIGLEDNIEYFYDYYEANYTINSAGKDDSLNVKDIFDIKYIKYAENNESFVVNKFNQVGGSYDKYFASHPDYSSEYIITELRQFNTSITVSGELTVNETISQEQANAELESMKTLYDISSYPVEKLDLSSIIG